MLSEQSCERVDDIERTKFEIECRKIIVEKWLRWNTSIKIQVDNFEKLLAKQVVVQLVFVLGKICPQ